MNNKNGESIKKVLSGLNNARPAKTQKSSVTSLLSNQIVPKAPPTSPPPPPTLSVTATLKQKDVCRKYSAIPIVPSSSKSVNKPVELEASQSDKKLDPNEAQDFQSTSSSSAASETAELPKANKIFYNGRLTRQDKYSSMTEYQAHAAELLHFLKSLWITNTMCDLSLVIGSRKYPAHKLGLAMFSRKYREEFQRDLVQSSSSSNNGVYTISLKSTTNQALESILKYIYTARIDINPANAEEILVASRELAIDDLVAMCTDYLNSLSIGDVLDYLSNVLSKQYEGNESAAAELMFYELYTYIMTHLDKVTRTPEYLRSSASTIRAILDDSHLLVHSEVQIFEAVIRWIEFDPANRLKENFSNELKEVMRCIRFTLISPDDLMTKIEGQFGSLDHNPDLHKLVCKAYRYHALGGRLMKREESRGMCLKGASVPDEFVKAVVELADIARKLKNTRVNTTKKLV